MVAAIVKTFLTNAQPGFSYHNSQHKALEPHWHQEIINHTVTETFAKVRKIIAEAKVDVLAVSLKEFTGFFRMSVTASLLFWVLCCGITCKWVLFIGLHRSLKNIIDLLPRA